MDEEKPTEDLTVDENGQINGAEKIEVSNDSGEVSGPAVNEIAPPEEPVEQEVIEETNVEPAGSETSENIVVEAPAELSVENDESTLGEIEAGSEETPKLSGPTAEIAGATTTQDFLFADSKPALENTKDPSTTLTHSNQENRNNKKLAAIVTVLVALIAAGAAIYMYISAQDNTKEANSTSQTQQSNSVVEETQNTNSPATQEDIDQATSEIDEAINSTDEATDLNENELSDTSLGIQ